MNVRSRLNDASSASSMWLNVAARLPTGSGRSVSLIRLVRSALRAIASAASPICAIRSRSCTVRSHPR